MQDSHTIPSTAYMDVGILNLSTRSTAKVPRNRERLRFEHQARYPTGVSPP